MDAEVIVVGAGPAGAATAFYLARLGRRVLLLDRQTFPRDKSCGDGITRAAARLLNEMGVLPRLGNVQKVRGIRVFMKGKGSRDFAYPGGLGEIDHGMVVPRLNLDHAICQQAVAAGAELWEEARVNRLIWSGSQIVGVEVVHHGQTKNLRAPIVVAADGAASLLARQAGLLDLPSENFGFAIRGYYAGVEGLDDRLEIYTPLLDATERYLLPSYGWVFPIGSKSANIGVGLFQRERGTNLRELFERFLEELRQNDSRFTQMVPSGVWKGAPIRFNFTPDRCLAPGLLLVGDAAGLISPFTGEGISYALESGKLAAEAIDRNLRPGMTYAPDLSDYALLLEKNYTGYFETGRQAARRYLLIWHVLASTFQNERPLYALCRQAVLFPEGVGEYYASKVLNDVSPLIPRYGLRVREDLIIIGELLMDVLRKDWPFLARLSAAGHGDPGIPFRPALLLLLSCYFGNPSSEQRIQVGAAVELGYMAALSHVSVEEEPNEVLTTNGNKPANWGNMLSLILGDFLLSKAYQISASAGTIVGKIIAESLAHVCEGQARAIRNASNFQLSETEYLDTLALRIGTLFELPCRLGAFLSGAPSAHLAALTEYGRYLGIAYQLAEEALMFTDQDGRFGRLTSSDLAGGLLNLPALRALKLKPLIADELYALFSKTRMSGRERQTARQLVRESGAIAETLEVAQTCARQSQAALNMLPEGPARLSLSRLAQYAATRQIPKTMDLKTVFQDDLGKAAS